MPEGETSSAPYLHADDLRPVRGAAIYRKRNLLAGEIGAHGKRLKGLIAGGIRRDRIEPAPHRQLSGLMAAKLISRAI